MKCLFVCLLIVTVTAAPAVAQPFQLGAELQEGATFDERNLPPERITGWYEIPDWLAGTTVRTKVSSILGLSFKSVRERTRGYQLDAQGGIWSPCLPFKYDIDHRTTIDHAFIATEEVLDSRPDRVIVRLDGILIRERKSDHKIISTTQSDETHVFRPGPNNTINASCSIGHYYDSKGKHLYDSQIKATYTEHLIATFKPIDQDDRHNYRRSFIAYLRNTGLRKLIPDDQPRSVWDDIQDQGR
ncbi:MAG: hypothetical protein WC714_04850 [Candidatus Obscuribacterales bacterium]|jgi:hypothetical protein|nr:hypothetical protein [Nevskia sp.]